MGSDFKRAYPTRAKIETSDHTALFSGKIHIFSNTMLSHIRKNAIFESYEFSSLLKLGLLSAIQSQLSHKNCFLPNNSCKNQGFTFFLLFTFWFRERLILLLFLNYAQSPQKSCKNETSSQLFLFWTHNQDTIEVKFSRLENTQIYKYSRSFVGRCHLGVSKRYGKHFVSVSRVKVALFGERNKEGSTNGLRCSLPRNLQAGSANEKKKKWSTSEVLFLDFARKQKTTLSPFLLMRLYRRHQRDFCSFSRGLLFSTFFIESACTFRWNFPSKTCWIIVA